VLMASAVVVLKHETSTLRQSHNFISLDFKLGVGDYVREITSPDKVGSGPMSGRDATSATYTGPVTYSSTQLQPIPVNQFSRTIPQDAVWCKKNPFGDVKLAVVKCRGVP